MTEQEALAWLANPDNWEIVEGITAHGVRGCDVPNCDANEPNGTTARNQTQRRWRFKHSREGEEMLNHWEKHRGYINTNYNTITSAEWAIVRCEAHYADLYPTPKHYPEIAALHELLEVIHGE